MLKSYDIGDASSSPFIVAAWSQYGRSVVAATVAVAAMVAAKPSMVAGEAAWRAVATACSDRFDFRESLRQILLVAVH